MNVSIHNYAIGQLKTNKQKTERKRKRKRKKERKRRDERKRRKRGKRRKKKKAGRQEDRKKGKKRKRRKNLFQPLFQCSLHLYSLCLLACVRTAQVRPAKSKAALEEILKNVFAFFYMQNCLWVNLVKACRFKKAKSCVVFCVSMIMLTAFPRTALSSF